MDHPSHDLTALLDAWSAGDPAAFDRLLPQVLDDLRYLARRFLAAERPDHTLQPTALVNELYLRLASRRRVAWKSKAQFFAFAAQLMRQILVDQARRRLRQKRGGDAERVPLTEELAWVEGREPRLLALDQALEGLAAIDPRQARVVELHYFAGSSCDEIGQLLGLSDRTVKRELRTARLWLRQRLADEASGEGWQENE